MCYVNYIVIVYNINVKDNFMQSAKDIFPLWEFEPGDHWDKAPVKTVKTSKPKKTKVAKHPKLPKESAEKKPRISRKNNIADKEPYDIVKIRKPRKKKEKPAPPPPPSKNCVICNDVFYRKRFHKDEQWDRLEICPNKSCWGKYAKSHVKRSGAIAKELPIKNCVICDKIITKPHKLGYKAMEKQQTCSKPCLSKLITQNSIEDDSEPDTIAIDPIIKMSELMVSIPDIVLVELQDHAVKNNVSTSDVAMVAMIEYLLKADSENITIKTIIRKLFKKEADARPNKRRNSKPSKI